MFEAVDFNSLPAPLRYAFILGAAVWGAIMVARRVRATLRAAPETNRELQMALTKLADQELRNDLIEVVRIARESIDQRVTQLGENFRLKCDSMEAQGKADRGEIHRRIDELGKIVGENREAIARLEAVNRRR